MMLTQLSSKLMACGRALPARQLRFLPFMAPQLVRNLASRPYQPAQAGKGKQAPLPPVVPEPEDDEDYDEEGADPLADYNAAARRRVLALKDVQKSYDEKQKEYLQELAALQQKYATIYAPFFDERKEIVLGKKAVEKYDVEDDGEKDTGIPEFWLNALANSKAGPFITDRDAEVLNFLTDIRYEVLTGSEEHGFKLTFEFVENPHFTNKTLEKKYLLELEDDVVPKQFIGCKVDWKDNMDVTVEYVKKRAKGAKGAKGDKPTFTTEKVPTDSFFNIFDPPKVPTAQEAEAMTMEELDEVQEALANDYEIGATVRDKVIPRAVEWFTGEIAPLDDYDYDGEYDEFDEGN